MQEFRCECGAIIDLGNDECYICGREIKTTHEFVGDGFEPVSCDLPPLPIGTIVHVINRQHAFADDIAIIRDKKFRHYRIEVRGAVIWVPAEWVEASPDE